MYKKYDERGTVKGGEWDRDIKKFEDTDVYRGFRDHFLMNKPWESTDYYQRVLSQVLSGTQKRGMTDRKDVDNRMTYLDKLYRKIEKSGYRTASDTADDRTAAFAGDEDEISVRIGRVGGLLFEDGRHRLAIAKLLGVEKIPVKVTVRHQDWFHFLREVHQYADEHSGEIYNSVHHPDLADIPVVHGAERADLIRKHLSGLSGRALDIGCHWGYYCIELAKMGFDCIGIEQSSQHGYFADGLMRASGYKYELRTESIFDTDLSEKFQVVLALYVFHHFLKEEEQLLKLENFLKMLDCEIMIFGSHNDDQPAMEKAFWNPSSDDMVEWLKDKGGFKTCELLGSESGRRSIYMLKK